MTRFVSLCVLSLCAVFALGGCWSKSDSPSEPVGETTAEIVPATTSGEVLPLNLSFTDPQLEDVITIAGFVPIFDVSAVSKQKFSADLDGGTVALVNVQAATGGEYFSPIQESKFHLVCDGKSLTPETSSFTSDMTAAGFVPLPDEGIPAGGSGDYWIAFMSGGNPNPTDCSLTYTRNPAVDADTDGDIPVFTTTVQLN